MATAKMVFVYVCKYVPTPWTMPHILGVYGSGGHSRAASAICAFMGIGAT